MMTPIYNALVDATYPCGVLGHNRGTLEDPVGLTYYWCPDCREEVLVDADR